MNIQEKEKEEEDAKEEEKEEANKEANEDAICKQVVMNNNNQTPRYIVPRQKKTRIPAQNWTFSEEHYEHAMQLTHIRTIFINQCVYQSSITKLMFQEINKKIYGYKQQDISKKLWNKTMFITLENVLRKMVECELKCYYCRHSMNVLYPISREMTQWSVDRIDNDMGHNADNFYLACLECNLKRRRRNDDKFLFTKQLKLVKT